MALPEVNRTLSEHTFLEMRHADHQVALQCVVCKGACRTLLPTPSALSKTQRHRATSQHPSHPQRYPPAHTQAPCTTPQQLCLAAAMVSGSARTDLHRQFALHVEREHVRSSSTWQSWQRTRHSFSQFSKLILGDDEHAWATTGRSRSLIYLYNWLPAHHKG